MSVLLTNAKNTRQVFIISSTKNKFSRFISFSVVRLEHGIMTLTIMNHGPSTIQNYMQHK